jgi:PD-(D/E)XK nuclease superfamily protein
MIWSVSTGKMFERCQRQWFFKTQLASAKAKDQTRRHAWRLSKLQSLSAWRGNLVDQVLSQEVLPAFRQGRSITADQTLSSAMVRFDRQLAIGRARRLHEGGFNPTAFGEDFVAFHALEYGGVLAEAEIERARDEVRRAIESFFSMEELIARLRTSDRLITQRALSFTHADTTVRAVPDLIVFKKAGPPAIVDWKVHAFGRHDAWLQLAVYAAALVRGTPHNDFPATGSFAETDVGLLEVQLLTGTLRRHRLTDEHIALADGHIARSLRKHASGYRRHEWEGFDVTTHRLSSDALCFNVRELPVQVDVLGDDAVTDIETNIFPILNLDDLKLRYDTYRVRNLRRDQDEYFQNRDSLVRDLSFKLKVPVQIIERKGETYVVVPGDVADVPQKFLLVRTYVYLDKVESGIPLDFNVRNPENDAICLRFIQFMMQAPLFRNNRLWQPSSGMGFFEKAPAEEAGGIGRYRGFAARATIAPSGRIGLCVDVHSKYVRTTSLPAHLSRLTFRQFQGQRCVYRYGHQWYELRIETFSDLNISDEQIRTADGPVSLFEFIARESRKPLPAELASLPHDASVIRYRNNRGEDRAAPSGLCYLVCDTQENALHQGAILPPHIRREQTSRFVSEYLTDLRFNDISIRVSSEPEQIEQKLFRVPDFEFGNGRKLSVQGTPGASQVSLDNLGRKRIDLLRDDRAGFYVKDRFRRQYLILPQSVWESWGERFVADLKQTVDGLYPEGGGYKPEIITYKDRGPRTYRDQGKAILEAVGDRFMESAYALVMLHPTTDRKVREHDLLAAMVIRELRAKDIYAAVNHSEMGERSYVMVSGKDGTPRYEVRDSQRSRFTGYLRNVALNKVLLTNNFWPFVLATPLHAEVTIGIDVKNQTAGFTVVGRNGSFVKSCCHTSRQKEKLLKVQVLTHLAEIIRDEKIRLGRPVKSVVIHRDGRCFQSEMDGPAAAIDKLKSEGVVAADGTLTILEISKSAPVRLRLFEVQRARGSKLFVQNPQVGLYTINRNEGFLCSTGRAFTRRGTVQPLHVRCVLEGIPFVQALEDAYALTTLAWTRPEDCSRYPVTIKLTDRWLGEEASEFDEEALLYEIEESDDKDGDERASA